MKVFIALVRMTSVGSVLPLALSAPAGAQDQGHVERRCLSIADVNARVECLETGVVPGPSPTFAQVPAPIKQQLTSPSFDCRLARSSIERAICSDATLSDWDSRMGQLFQQALQLTRDRQALLDNQRLWLAHRNNSCGTVADTAIWSCLLEATKARASSLEKAIVTSATASQSTLTAVTGSSQSYAAAAQAGAPPTPATPPPPRGQQSDRPQSAQPRNESGPLTIVAFALGLFALIAFNLIRRSRRTAAEREQAAAEQRRRESYVQNLVARYGEHAAMRILAHEVWQGMTNEQLMESRGQPSDVGREIIREKTRET